MCILATPSTSLKICYYPSPHLCSRRFEGNIEHYLGKVGAIAPYPVAMPLSLNRISVNILKGRSVAANVVTVLQLPVQIRL